MAVSKKSSQTRAKTAGRGKSSSGKKSVPESSFKNEIILLLVLALVIILLISNFGIGGVVGSAISSVGFGLFGLMSYVFPFLLFIGIAFLLSNSRNPLAIKKMTAGVVFFIFLCALVQLLTEGFMKTTPLLEYYTYSSSYQTGGGIVGGALCKACGIAFGIVGAYVIISVILLISLIIITQRSFLHFFRKIFGRLGTSVRNGMEKRQVSRQDRKAIEKEERQSLSARNKENNRSAMSEAPEGKKFLEGTLLSVPSSVEEEPEQPKQLEFEIHRSEPAAHEEPAEAAKSAAVRSNIGVRSQESQPATVMPMGGLAGAESQTEKESSSVKAAKSSKEEIESGIKNIKHEIENQAPKPKKAYQFPPLSLMKRGGKAGGDSDAYLRETAQKLQNTLHSFGVHVTVTNVSCGPTVTRYELQPEQGVKVSRIVSLSDDIKLNLATPDIRIEAPIPGKAAVGIEVPNKVNSPVMLRDLLQAPAFQNAKSKLSFAAGKDIAGKPVVTDIAKMPHLLIAGATGSGKSVCINTLIMSILYKATPDEVKMIMIDPKVVELSVYNGIPHLYIPVVTDPKKAAGALNWAVAEMTDRYNAFAEYNVRNLEDFNEKISQMDWPKDDPAKPEKMPQIVIIVDELADLMMVAPGEVEDAICRLAQLARAAGIHLVIATQRPSVNVITGLIKANMPSRIAFSVSSGVDSRTILDMNGAEKLLGKGDMLFYPQGYQKPARLQGAYVSDQEVSAVVEFLNHKNPKTEYSQEITQQINTASFTNGAGSQEGEDRDTYFIDAGKFIIEKDKASIGMLQRMFKIGFNRAARIMDQLSDAGVVGPEEGTKPRKVLMSQEEFEQYIEESL